MSAENRRDAEAQRLAELTQRNVGAREGCIVMQCDAVLKRLLDHEARLATRQKLPGPRAGVLTVFNLSARHGKDRHMVKNHSESSASLRLCGERTAASRSHFAGLNAIPYRKRAEYLHVAKPGAHS